MNAVVVDGKEQGSYAVIGSSSLAFTPDSSRVLLTVRDKGKFFMVSEGKEGRRYDGISLGSTVFSPDGRRMAYVALTGNRQFVVVDESEGRRYEAVITTGGGRLVFDSPTELRYNVIRDTSHIYQVIERFEDTPEQVPPPQAARPAARPAGHAGQA